MRETATAAVLAGAVGGLVGSLPGGTGPSVAGAVVGAVVGAVAGTLAARRQRRRVDRLVSDLEGWSAGPSGRRTVSLPGRGEWRELGRVLVAIGATLDAQDAELEDGRPWRHDLVESLGGPAILFDRDGYLVSANRAAQELLRIPEGRRATVIQALGSTVLADAVAHARRTPGHVEVDAELGTSQVHASVSEVAGETLVILSDRTRERRVEELRRNFVVNASHELKTPATSIQTLSEALEITAVRNPDRVPQLVARLREESERLVRLVHDLLNLRRVEDRGDVTRVRLDLAESARTVIADLRERADERGISVTFDAPESVEVTGDPDDLRLVVRNLVANAIQYNRHGGDVSVRIVPGGEDVAIEVADTGIGIPQQDLQRVFERFYRVDVARSRQTGGTGLGLSIVRHAVERHRGTIRVDSLLGEGTTFTVTLPAGSPDD